MHPREISKLARIKCKAVAAAFSQASKNHGVGGGEKVGEMGHTAECIFGASKMSMCSKSSWQGDFHRLDSRQRKKGKALGKIVSCLGVPAYEIC